jgi:hypothetical protein
MRIEEAKEYLNSKGYILEENQELNEGVLTIAAGVTLGLIALKVVGKVLGVGLKGLANVLTQANHLAILKVIDRDKDIIAAELKEYMMSDAEVSELIENKSITVKQIQEWIEKSSNKLIQPEFKANGLKMANNELHDRQLKSRGWKGGVSGGLKGHFDNHEKIREISSKLAQVVYDTIYEVKNESTICEGAYKDILHQKFAEKRAKREQDQKDYEAKQRKMAKISKKLNKEIEEFISDLADELVSDKVTCKYDKNDWITIIQIENKQFKVDTYGWGVVEFAKYEYGRWNNIFNTRDLDNLDEFLEKVFEYLTDQVA